MKYPDGVEVQVGDSVALHYRTYTGIVREIIESAEDIHAWGMGEAG